MIEILLIGLFIVGLGGVGYFFLSKMQPFIWEASCLAGYGMTSKQFTEFHKEHYHLFDSYYIKKSAKKKFMEDLKNPEKRKAMIEKLEIMKGIKEVVN